MRTLALASLLALTASPLLAQQDSYWIASRASAELHELSPSGEVLNVIDLSSNGFSLRRVEQAPDGKLWVINFIQSTVTLINPDGTGLNNITHQLGSAYDVAFDSAGHAWVTGGTGVEEFDAAGNTVNTYPLTAPAPLGIAIDVDGNKWIAHRDTAPGSVSRIDGTSGAITNIPMPVALTFLPTQVHADYRGLGNSSHIWVVGDRSGDVAELDASGTILNTYVFPTTNISAFAGDVNGNLVVGDFRSGDIHTLDSATGTINTIGQTLPNCLGLAFDGYGALWSSVRVTFSNDPNLPPCEVRRVDLTTGTEEAVGFVGYGTQSALSTRYDYALVVDPFGDIDGDGAANIGELFAGSSPFNACSIPNATIFATGSTQVGNTFDVEVLAPASGVTFVAIADAVVAAGSGITLPGFACEALLDPTQVIGGTQFVVGPGTLSYTVPNSAAFQGYTAYFQGITVDNSGNRFTNVTSATGW